jgi:hypothetical protein
VSADSILVEDVDIECGVVCDRVAQVINFELYAGWPQAATSSEQVQDHALRVGITKLLN